MGNQYNKWPIWIMFFIFLLVVMISAYNWIKGYLNIYKSVFSRMI